MSLQQLDISHFRNLYQVSIKPGTGLNIITGLNAAGKTSLLESIFYLSYGRSFRHSQTRDLIEYNQPYFRLVAKLNTDHHTRILGIQKDQKQQIIRIDQQDISRISDLSALFPVIALHPDTHQLISSGPEHRRQFLDWGVFHVEHSFIQVWKTFKTALSQRNAALRQGQAERMCRLWDDRLVTSANQIDELRRQYLDKLNKHINHLSQQLFPQNRISLDYKPGWLGEASYEDCLTTQFAKDREKGFTQAGPHRADIRIRLDDKSAQTAISRGQQKKLVALLKLAQLELFANSSEKTCVLLYDDLPAELDADNRHKLMSILSTMNVQVFVSAIELSQIDTAAWNSVTVFHVEHGGVEEVQV